MPKIKSGEIISWSEYMRRWKEGVAMVSPLQKAKVQIHSYRIQLVGIIAGLVISVYNYKFAWWVAIILFGILINTYLQYRQIKVSLIRMKKLDEESEVEDLHSLLDEIKVDEREDEIV